jgi:hypothetical protein
MSDPQIIGYEPNGLAKWSDGAVRFAVFKNNELVRQCESMVEIDEYRRASKQPLDGASTVTITAGESSWTKHFGDPE